MDDQFLNDTVSTLGTQKCRWFAFSIQKGKGCPESQNWSNLYRLIEVRVAATPPKNASRIFLRAISIFRGSLFKVLREQRKLL